MTDFLQILTVNSGLLHDTGAGHPECAARLQTILDMLVADFTSVPIEDINEPAALELLTLGHDPQYSQQLIEIQEFPTFLDSDTIVSKHTIHAARCAVQAAVEGINRLQKHQTKAVFIAARPPGHHADFNQAMGFCFFNTAYIAARYATTLGYKSVVVVDFDVHHGNGTAALVARFADIPVSYASIHLHPFYPNTGARVDNPSICNVPLAFGARAKDFRNAYKSEILPFIAVKKSDFLIFSAGFDAHGDDPLGNMGLSADDYGWLTRVTLQECGDIPVLSVLEGGYDLLGLEESLAEHLQMLATNRQAG